MGPAEISALQKAHRRKIKREQEFIAAVHGCEIRCDSDDDENEITPEQQAEMTRLQHKAIAAEFARRAKNN